MTLRRARLKVIVKHLADTWPHVLQRQICMQSLGRREDLHIALAESHVTHITNMLQDVLVIDLLREIGASSSSTRSQQGSRAIRWCFSRIPVSLGSGSMRVHGSRLRGSEDFTAGDFS